MASSSFRNKLLIRVLSATTIVISITMFILGKYSFDTAEEGTKVYLKELSNNYAAKVQGDVNLSSSLVKAIWAKFQEGINHNSKFNEKESVELFKTILKDNDQLLGIWWSTKDPNILFETNASNTTYPKNWYSTDGSFSPYITRGKDGIIVDPGSAYDEENGWIKGPKLAKKMYITEPYVYPIAGVDTLMSTIAMPLYKDGEFVGAVGAEIDLQKLSTMTKENKVYENGYFFIVDNYGVILGHPDEKNVAKKLLDVVTNDSSYKQALDNVESLKDYSFDKESFKTGLESHYYVKPFNIKGAEVNWSIFVNAPKEEFLANAIFIRNVSIVLSLICLIVIAIVIIITTKILKQTFIQ